jgi:hypothetical protein
MPEPFVEATEPKLLEGGESAKDSLELWKASEAKVEISDEHATEGKHSIKATYPVSQEWPGLKFDLKDKPLDWRPYKSLEFDAYNPDDKAIEISIRLDGINSIDKNGRYGIDGISLPPKTKKTVKLDIWRPAGRGGCRIDKSKITLLSIFLCSPGKEYVIYYDNFRLGVTRAGGLINKVEPGRIPGKNPKALAKDMLEDPEIKPLLPIFKAMPPKRFVMLSHSASMTEHFATSAGYLDIVGETIKLVNPETQYTGFHHGCMTAEQAVNQYLKKMVAYKPTDTFIAFFPDPVTALFKISDDMVGAGSRVFIFDDFPWINYMGGAARPIKDYAKKKGNNVVRYVEIVPRTWGAPGSYKWKGIDEHMMTPGHIFYAREVLKELAKVYAAEAGGGDKPADPK